MPVKRYDLTLGFIGSGEVSVKNMTALLKDLIQAHGKTAKFIVPMTTAHWTESLASVVEFAEDHDHTIEAVIDDDTKAAKKHLPLARKTHKAEDVPTALVGLLDGPTAKLIVLWDDDDEEMEDAAVLAEEQGIETLDLTAGLDVVELAEGDADEMERDEAPRAKLRSVPDDEEEVYTKKELLKLAKDNKHDELEKIALSFDIDVESLKEWEDVAIAIYEAQSDNSTGDDAAEGDADDEDAITPDEVAKWDFAQLKEFAKTNKVEVPPRTKSSGYRKAILAFLDEDEEAPAAPEETVDEPEDAPAAPRRARREEPEAVASEDEATPGLVSILGRLVDVLERMEGAAPKRAKKASARDMTEEEATAIVEEYEKGGRRRGRPPAEVTEARRVLDID